MNEYELETKVEELFEPFANFAYDLSLDDALHAAETLRDQVQGYISGLEADIRRRDS